MTILEKILRTKRDEVTALKKRCPVFQKPIGINRPSLYERLCNTEALLVIAEMKRHSPSRGVINPSADSAQQALRYEQAGAGAISVLTDAEFFKGSFADLEAAGQSTSLPLLCKDFIIDTLQIDRARYYGASVILLIAAALDLDTLQILYDYASGMGLDVLVEVHTEKEAEAAAWMGARIIGVNNRDLQTFRVDLGTTERIAAAVDFGEAVLISESGIHSSEDALRARKAGARGILVGEALMSSRDIQQTVAELRIRL